MPAKQKSPAKKKSKQEEVELSEDESQLEEFNEDESTTRITQRLRKSTRLSSKKLNELSESNKRKSDALTKSTNKEALKKKKKRKYLSIKDEMKISASNAKLLSFIVGNKIPVGRNEITLRAKNFLRSCEEFEDLKMTVTALNSISLIMNHRFASLFRIASILAEYREVKTINALDLDIAKDILDGKLSSINSDPNQYFKTIREYRNKDVVQGVVDNQIADKLLTSIKKATLIEKEPTQEEITNIFNDKETMEKISKELKNYQKPISTSKIQ